MKKKGSTLLLIVALLIGLSLLLYPTVSNYWNQFHQSRAIATYTDAVVALDEDTYAQLWQDAQAYNQDLLRLQDRFIPTEEETARYNALLNVAGNGIMGYIEIPAIGVSLPIYHGTSDTVLQIAVGHIEGSSLPVGGLGTHCVLSGHRGLPSAKLFTDLDQLAVGDLFTLRVLDEVLTYQVDQIHIVLPYEMDLLEPDPDLDLCTLVTCTPYGVNSHRLLVRGVRVETVEEAAPVFVSADAVQIEPVLVAPLVAAPILLVLLLLVLLGGGKGRKKRQDHES